MPASRRTIVEVFREDLRGLKKQAGGLKRRATSLPYQFTIGWSCWTATAACGVGLIVFDNTTPRPGHRVWDLYAVGLVGFGVAGFVLLLWWLRTRKSHWQDVDDLIEEIDRIEYESPESPQ